MEDSLDTGINFNEIDEINIGLDELKSEINNNQNGGERINNSEQVEKYIEPQVIIDAMFNYLKKEVTFFKYLNSGTKNEISGVIKTYLSKHHLLAIWKDGKMKLVLNDEGKKDFIAMSKRIVNMMKNEVMNNKVIKSSLRLCWKYKKVIKSIDKLYNYLDNLDKNLYNMPTKKYMDIMFGYVWWIIKEILLKNNLWNMTIWEFFGYISGYYPNKNNKAINWIISTTRKKWGHKFIKDEFITDATWVGFD